MKKMKYWYVQKLREETRKRFKPGGDGGGVKEGEKERTFTYKPQIRHVYGRETCMMGD